MRRFLSFLFLGMILFTFWHCARRGNPTGGPKDLDPPILIRAEPENMTTNFDAERIRLYFDEFIKLQDVQEQLIISPPLKYTPEIKPLGGASKFVEINIKDTLAENTTYTLNFGQSITDNNEGNPNSFLTYVFSTGDYIDSLTLSGVVKDAFNKEADEFISVMLYALDTAYTDSTPYRNPPNYITNTLDSTVIFTLRNLKEGDYKLFAIKDAGKNNVFDQNTDKIAFLQDTITLPTDTTYLLTLFREIPDYNASVPSFAAGNKIIFGFSGPTDSVFIEPLTQLPDSIDTRIMKERDKDTLNFWFTTFEPDSIVFAVRHPPLHRIDTFTVKSRKLPTDSLVLTANQRGSLNFHESFKLLANTPLTAIDTTLMELMKQDSTAHPFLVELDSIANAVDFDFEIDPNEGYMLTMLPGAITDFFEETNDTITYRLNTRSLADYGNLRLTIEGDSLRYPLIVQLTDQSGKTLREIYASEPQVFEFNTIEPATYLVRIVFDTNGNGTWDTGNYLRKLQPERVTYYPDAIEVRANWELEQNLIIDR